MREKYFGRRATTGPPSCWSPIIGVMPYVKVQAHNPQGPFWQGYEWSKWVSLRDARPGRAQGIYRVRRQRSRGLLYIGISGNLAARAGTLRRGVFDQRGGHPAPSEGMEAVWCGLSVRSADGALTPVPLRDVLFARLESALEPVESEPQADWLGEVLPWTEVVRFYVRAVD